MVVGHPSRGTLGPLHDDERSLRENVIPADVRELRLVVEAIEIDVIHGRFFRIVAVNERIRRTRDRLADSVALADRLRERRLPRAELTSQRYQERRLAR